MRLAPFYNAVSPLLDRLPLPIDGGVIILAYHGVADSDPNDLPDYFLPAEVFRRQVQLLSKEADIISLKEAVTALNDRKQLPRRPVVVTFDDGYRNNVTLACPILKDLGAPATFFVTTGYMGSEDLLPLDEAYLLLQHARHQDRKILVPIFESAFPGCQGRGQISTKDIAKYLKQLPTAQQVKLVRQWRQHQGNDHRTSELAGEFLFMAEEDARALASDPLFDFGAHTVSHQICSAVSHEDAYREISLSKAQLEGIIGRPVTLFAYPNGTRFDYTPDHVLYLRQNGFSAAVTTEARVNLPGDNPFTLGRICIGEAEWRTISRFRACISTTFLLRLNYGGGKRRRQSPDAERRMLPREDLAP